MGGTGRKKGRAGTVIPCSGLVYGTARPIRSIHFFFLITNQISEKLPAPTATVEVVAMAEMADTVETEETYLTAIKEPLQYIQTVICNLVNAD